MTEPDWPPPLCDACLFEFHDHCTGWCECLVTYCYERLLRETP